MYTQKIRRQWDPNASAEVLDTVYSLYNVWDFSASVSASTKVYGFFQPLPFLGDKVKMIRYVLTPSISFSGSPDFGSPFFGYYGKPIRSRMPTANCRRDSTPTSPTASSACRGRGATAL